MYVVQANPGQCGDYPQKWLSLCSLQLNWESFLKFRSSDCSDALIEVTCNKQVMQILRSTPAWRQRMRQDLLGASHPFFCLQALVAKVMHLSTSRWWVMSLAFRWFQMLVILWVRQKPVGWELVAKAGGGSSSMTSITMIWQFNCQCIDPGSIQAHCPHLFWEM